jgi:Antibiotic biosynthesis monooxygenase
MSTIRALQGIVTQVNVFTCTPENQQPLIDLLIESARAVSHIPGWLSANIHRSLDGRQVVNYAQCESMEAQERVFQALQRGGFLERNKALGDAHPCLYEVVFTLERE